MAEPVPRLFLKTLAALTRWLEEARAPAMIVGSLAASILGRPRATRDIDIILGRLPFEEEAISRAEWHDLGGVRVHLPQVEDLLIMKAIAQRPQDLRHIEGLLDVHPGADIERVRRWVREFAAATAMPDLLKVLEQLLEQRSSSPRR